MDSQPRTLRWRGSRRAGAVVLGVLAVLLVLALNPSTRDALRAFAVSGWGLSVGAASSTTGAAREGATAASLAEQSAPPTLHWMPAPTGSWRWVPAGQADLEPAADVYVLDLATTSPATVAAIHDRGGHAICRVEVGIVDSSSPTTADLDPTALGKPVPGRPTARYVDIARLDALRPFLSKRLDECWTKGFDGVAAVAVDTPTTAGPDAVGFPVTSAHEIALVRTTSALAHTRGLAFGLHASAADSPRTDFVAALEPVSDFAVVERCFAVGLTCPAFSAFAGHRKAVFHVEYLADHPGASATDPRPALDRFCPATKPLGFSSILRDGTGASPDWLATCP